MAVGRADDARLATLFDLFISGRTLSKSAVRRALDPLELEELQRAGLLGFDDDAVRAEVRLAVNGDMIVGGDSPFPSGSWDVVPLTASARTLAALTMREPVAVALDLGTGSGIQALLAARHAERVVGIDINPKALRFARLGQRLNRVANVEWREGSWFEPVTGESFDLIVCNPPYVISPDRAFVFRDSAEDAEALCRRLVRSSAEHLTGAGYATLLVNWAHRSEDWSAPLREWVAGLPCDAVLLRYLSQDPAAYAVNWNRHLNAADPSAFEATVTRWVEYHQRSDIDLIGTGAIVLRRSSGSDTPWVRTFEPQHPPPGTGGAQLGRIFAAGDLRGHNALDALLGRAWRLAEGNRLEQTLPFVDGAYVPQTAALVCDDGIGLGANVDPRVLAVLFALDGQTPFKDLVQATPVPENLDEGEFLGLCATTFEQLLERGFLIPARA